MIKWDRRFVDLATHVSCWSKDSTKVGCVLIGENKEILSIGYNGFPRGVNDSIEDRMVRPEKYMWSEHAERNAIYNAVRHGIKLEGATAYINLYPCCDCARALIQSGIRRIVTKAPNFNDERWGKSWHTSMIMFSEADINVSFIT